MPVYPRILNSPDSETSLALHSSSSEEFESLHSLPIKGLYIDEGRSYARLQSDYEHQQEELLSLRAINEEQAYSLKRLDAELFAMTRRYLQAREKADELEKRCAEAEARLEAITSQHLDESEEVPFYLAEVDTEGEKPNQQGLMVRGESQEHNAARNNGQLTVRSPSPQTSERSSTDLPRPAAIVGATPTICEKRSSPEELVKLVRSINLQSLEIARVCIGAVNFRAGVRVPLVDNKMITSVTEGIGCVLLQMLREKDHSRDRGLVELALQTVLVHHVAKIVDNWPFPLEGGVDGAGRRTPEESGSSPTSRPRFSRIVDGALDDIVTIFSLCGSPGHILDLKRKHEDRVGSTIDALFKSAELLASQVKSGPILQAADASFSTEYKLLSARPSATFNKDIMQKQGPQPHGISMWKSTSKKSSHVLCTKEIGVACLRRETGRSSSKELEVLTKAVVVFESEVSR